MDATPLVELDWLAQTFDIGRPIAMTLAGRGQNNPLGVLRLDTSTGTFAIKQMDREPAHSAMLIEWAAYESGFPMPRPVRTRGGELYGVCLCGAAQRRVWVRAYTWAEGTPYAWGTVNPRASAGVGRLLALLHALRVPAELLREDAPWRPLGHSEWARMAERGEALGMPWMHTLRDKAPTLATWEDYVLTHAIHDEPKAPSQRDLHPPNVIRQHDGRHVLVDWDGAGPVDGRAEVAKYALVWATPEGEGQSPRANVVRAFIEGYRAAGGQFQSRGIADLTHQTASLLWWIAYNVERDVHGRPDAQPDLTLALLSHIRAFDIEALARTAALLLV